MNNLTLDGTVTGITKSGSAENIPYYYYYYNNYYH